MHLQMIFLLYIWMGPRPRFSPLIFVFEIYEQYLTWNKRVVLHQNKDEIKLSSTSISWRKTIIVDHIDFELKSWCGLEINMAHTNRDLVYYFR